MSFCTPIPAPLRKTLWKLGLIYGTMSLVGLAYGTFGQDARLCLLSLAIGVIGTVKLLGLLDRIRSRRFTTYQGVVLSDKHIPFRNRHTLTILDPEYNDEHIVDVAGRDWFLCGRHYKVYLIRPSGIFDCNEWLPKSLRQPAILLGYELLN